MADEKDQKGGPAAEPDEILKLRQTDREALTPAHGKAFEEFTDKISKAIPGHKANEYTLLRFLRARKFKVEAAVDMYTEYMRWRSANRVDHVMENPPTAIRQLLNKFVPESFHGHDKFGHPAYFIKVGKIKYKELHAYVTKEEFLRAHIWGMEYSFQRARECSQRFGKNIDQFINIVDLDGLSWGHRSAMTFVKAVAKLDERYYPESLGKTFVINAPMVFPILWNLISPFIDPVTKTKITVLRGNFQKELLDRFDPDQLPKEYGGTCQCDGGCVREYTAAEVETAIAEEEKRWKFQSLELLAGKAHTVTLKAGPHGSTFTSYFKITSNDVQVTASFVPDDAKHAPISWMSTTKFDGKNPHKNAFAIARPGTLHFTFDNKHSSWFTTRLMWSLNQEDLDEQAAAEVRRRASEAVEPAHSAQDDASAPPPDAAAAAAAQLEGLSVQDS